MSGVSTSFISDLTNGKGNPSYGLCNELQMAWINLYPKLLKETDLDSK